MHPQMPVETLSCKKGALGEHDLDDHIWYEGALVPMELETFRNAPSTLKGLEHRILPSRLCIFQGRAWVFQLVKLHICLGAELTC